MSDHHAKQAAEQQRRFPGFSAPGSLPISIFPSLISGVYEIPEFQSHTIHFRMEQLPLPVLRLSKFTSALCRRPSLYLMPAFPCAVFCFVCAFFPTHKHVGAVSIICLWPPLKAIHKRIYVHVCSPTTGLVVFCTSNNKCKCVYSHFQSVLCHCRNMQLKPEEPVIRREHLQSQVTLFLSKMEKHKSPTN